MGKYDLKKPYVEFKGLEKGGKGKGGKIAPVIPIILLIVFFLVYISIRPVQTFVNVNVEKITVAGVLILFFYYTLLPVFYGGPVYRIDKGTGKIIRRKVFPPSKDVLADVHNVTALKTGYKNVNRRYGINQDKQLFLVISEFNEIPVKESGDHDEITELAAFLERFLNVPLYEEGKEEGDEFRFRPIKEAGPDGEELPFYMKLSQSPPKSAETNDKDKIEVVKQHGSFLIQASPGNPWMSVIKRPGLDLAVLAFISAACIMVFTLYIVINYDLLQKSPVNVLTGNVPISCLFFGIVPGVFALVLFFGRMGKTLTIEVTASEIVLRPSGSYPVKLNVDEIQSVSVEKDLETSAPLMRLAFFTHKGEKVMVENSLAEGACYELANNIRNLVRRLRSAT